MFAEWYGLGATPPTTQPVDITGVPLPPSPGAQPIGYRADGTPVWIPEFVVGKTPEGKPIYAPTPGGTSASPPWLWLGLAAAAVVLVGFAMKGR